MDNVKLQNIVDALEENDIEDGKAYFSEGELNPSNITVEVEGVGTIEFPLTQSCIETLIGVSSKAKFGLREKTVLDENVRNTHVIAAEKLRVVIDPSTASQLMETIRNDLELDDSSELSPHLHNMLIYGPGQFFKMHKDTEKMDNMVATLVVVLPSPHIGGDLVIHQGAEKHVFSTENLADQSVKCIAFYADCLHNIKPVKQGYRVALTFNLVLNSADSLSDQRNQSLKNALQEYFYDEHFEKPLKLVYFLDHEYSEHGLKWGLLKGNDRVNASSLFTVANSLNLVPHLALVEIQNTCGGYDDELIESDTTLSYWVDAFNKKLNYGNLTIDDEEVCWMKDTEEFEPYKTEDEGYTGNAEGTKDLWYRRAAVVLWPESRKIGMEFMFNQKKAFQKLKELTRVPGNEDEVINSVCQAGKHLYGNYLQPDEQLIELADIVLYIHDPKVAIDILLHFSCSVLTVSTAECLAKFQVEYGVDWCIDLLEKWKRGRSNCDINEVDDFVKIFIQNKGDVKIAGLLLEQQNVAEVQSYYHWGTRKYEKLRRVFKACEAIENVSLLHKFIEIVKENSSTYPLLELVDFFLNLKSEMSPVFYAHLEPLKAYLVNSVSTELVSGKKFANDWSLNVHRANCHCAPCSEAIAFLTSKTEVKKVFSMLVKSRNHVISKLKGLFLPIDVSVDKSCTPQRLVIQKQSTMHAKAFERYNKLVQCQQALNKHCF